MGEKGDFAEGDGFPDLQPLFAFAYAFTDLISRLVCVAGCQTSTYGQWVAEVGLLCLGKKMSGLFVGVRAQNLNEPSCLVGIKEATGTNSSAQNANFLPSHAQDRGDIA